MNSAFLWLEILLKTFYNNILSFQVNPRTIVAPRLFNMDYLGFDLTQVPP